MSAAARRRVLFRDLQFLRRHFLQSVARRAVEDEEQRLVTEGGHFRLRRRRWLDIVAAGQVKVGFNLQ